MKELTFNKEEVMNFFDNLKNDENSTLNLLLVVSVFATLITPYLSNYVVSVFHHDYFRIIVLAIIVFLYTKKATTVTFIILVLFLSTQIASIQKEHYGVVQNVNLENFSPSEAVVDETFHINPEYFRESADMPLEGVPSDAPAQHPSDYLLYNNNEHIPNETIISEQPVFHEMQEVTGYTGEENAPVY